MLTLILMLMLVMVHVRLPRFSGRRRRLRTIFISDHGDGAIIGRLGMLVKLTRHVFHGRLVLGRLSGEQLVRIIRHPRDLPRETLQGHATVDDGQRPDIRRLWIVLIVVKHLRCQVWIRSHHA